MTNTGLFVTSKRPEPEPEAPRRLKVVVLLRLTMATTDDEGAVLETTSWCAGLNENLALSAWKRTHRDLAALVTKVEVVSPQKAEVVSKATADDMHVPRISRIRPRV